VIIIDIVVDIVFASTSINNCLHFLDRFLFYNTHGENDLSCDYNVHRGAVRDRATSIQGIEGGSLLLLLVLAVKKREVSDMRKENRRNGTKVQWNP
jgi:hypothetical protein